MNTPKFHVATTIDGITVDIRVAIDPADGPLCGKAFLVHALRSEISDAIRDTLNERATDTIGSVQEAVRRGLWEINKERDESVAHRERMVASVAREAATKEAGAITDPIIKKLEAANETLRNELATLKAWPGTKPRRAKKGGAK